MASKLKPGQIAPRSGQYAVFNAEGKELCREITMVAGKRLPPAPQAGVRYQLTDKTRHKYSKECQY